MPGGVGGARASPASTRFDEAAGGNQTSRASTRRAVQAPLADPTTPAPPSAAQEEPPLDGHDDRRRRDPPRLASGETQGGPRPSDEVGVFPRMTGKAVLRIGPVPPDCAYPRAEKSRKL